MDLFEDKKEINDSFNADVARELVRIYHEELKGIMYPFNHILTAARYGRTMIKKPLKGLIPEDANKLKQLGFDVKFNMEKEEWTISWK
jgi:hypothetical protein